MYMYVSRIPFPSLHNHKFVRILAVVYHMSVYNKYVKCFFVLFNRKVHKIEICISYLLFFSSLVHTYICFCVRSNKIKMKYPTTKTQFYWSSWIDSTITWWRWESTKCLNRIRYFRFPFCDILILNSNKCMLYERCKKSKHYNF